MTVSASLIGKPLAAVAALAAAAMAVWTFLVPEAYLLAALERAGRSGPVMVEAAGFGKGLFLSVKAEELRVRLDGRDEPLAVATGFTARIEPYSLITFAPAVLFDGFIGGGAVKGRAALTGARAYEAAGRAVELSAIPALARLPAVAAGRLDFDLSGRRGGEGGAPVLDARFEAVVDGLKYAAPPFGLPPLDGVRTVRGAARAVGGRLEVKSLSFEGDGFYARLTGTVEAGRADLLIEADIESRVLAGPAAAFLERYRVRPGRYELRYRGALP